MARIAHLSDFHLLEPHVRERRGKDWLRVHYLSFKRSIDYLTRRTRAERALLQARDAGFDQLVITGDLTEDGHLAQFEVLAELLAHSGIPPEKILLCPGNHDTYGRAWEDAMAGPLRPWDRTEVWLDDAVILSVSTAIHQTYLRSAGRVDASALERTDEVARGEPGRAVVAAQHHPPFALFNQWIHGLQDHAKVTGLMENRENLNVLHGHTHKEHQRALDVGGPLRVFSPSAVAESPTPLRLYDVVEGGLVPVPVVEGPLLAVAHELEALATTVMDDVRHEVDAFMK